MGASDWMKVLRSPQFLGELYEGSPPIPEQCDLFYVHIDERGNSVTLGFDTRSLPSNPRPEWREKPFNSFEFYLLFSDVIEFRTTGWGAAEAREIQFKAEPAKAITVSLGRDESGIRFRAASMRLASTRVYLAAEGF
jgi:hypothetical protein